MRLSVSTCSHAKVLWGKTIHFTAEEAIDLLFQSGFRVLDFHFLDQSGSGGPMTRPGWKDWLASVRDKTEKLGIEWSQGHAFCYPDDGLRDQINPDYEELVERSIIGAGILGVKTLVMHPKNFFVDDDASKPYDYARSLRMNRTYFSRYLDILQKYSGSTRIAIENLFNVQEKKANRYGTTADELMEFIGYFPASSVGICWDFGHANLSGQDQCASLRTCGDRLYATHVHDNHGLIDEHLVPYLGHIRWEPVMKTLEEIGYQGDFTFEIHNYTAGMPADILLRKEALALARSVGEYLLRIAGC